MCIRDRSLSCTVFEILTLTGYAYFPTRVSAAADRPARRSDSAHAKYTTSHHVLIKQFLLLGLCWIQISTVSVYRVINFAADHQMFLTLTGELS